MPNNAASPATPLLNKSDEKTDALNLISWINENRDRKNRQKLVSHDEKDFLAKLNLLVDYSVAKKPFEERAKACDAIEVYLFANQKYRALIADNVKLQTLLLKLFAIASKLDALKRRLALISFTPNSDAYLTALNDLIAGMLFFDAQKLIIAISENSGAVDEEGSIYKDLGDASQKQAIIKHFTIRFVSDSKIINTAANTSNEIFGWKVFMVMLDKMPALDSKTIQQLLKDFAKNKKYEELLALNKAGFHRFRRLLIDMELLGCVENLDIRASLIRDSSDNCENIDCFVNDLIEKKDWRGLANLSDSINIQLNTFNAAIAAITQDTSQENQSQKIAAIIKLCKIYKFAPKDQTNFAEQLNVIIAKGDIELAKAMFMHGGHLLTTKSVSGLVNQLFNKAAAVVHQTTATTIDEKSNTQTKKTTIDYDFVIQLDQHNYQRKDRLTPDQIECVRELAKSVVLKLVVAKTDPNELRARFLPKGNKFLPLPLLQERQPKYTRWNLSFGGRHTVDGVAQTGKWSEIIQQVERKLSSAQAASNADNDLGHFDDTASVSSGISMALVVKPPVQVIVAAPNSGVAAVKKRVEPLETFKPV